MVKRQAKRIAGIPESPQRLIHRAFADFSSRRRGTIRFLWKTFVIPMAFQIAMFVEDWNLQIFFVGIAPEPIGPQSTSADVAQAHFLR